MKKVFTLIEILIVVIVIGILATLAIPAYRNVVENAKTRTCVLNQQALLGAIEAFLIENDELPASLGELRYRHRQRGWAKLLEKEGSWKVDLTYFIVNFDKAGLAYAQSIRELVDATALHCPAQPSNRNLPHYELGADVVGANRIVYEALDLDTVVVSDIGQPHARISLVSSDDYEVAITKGGDISYPGRGEGNGGEGNGGEGEPGEDCPGGSMRDCQQACSPPGDDACHRACAQNCRSGDDSG